MRTVPKACIRAMFEMPRNLLLVISRYTPDVIHNLFCSGVEHQRADWLGIHEKICQQMIPLRTPLPFVSSEEERRHMDEQRLMRQVTSIPIQHMLKYDFRFRCK